MARTSTAANAPLTPEREQAIALTLLGCAEFRARAGLPSRSPGEPVSFELLATVAGVSRQAIHGVYTRALTKIRRELSRITNHDNL